MRIIESMMVGLSLGQFLKPIGTQGLKSIVSADYADGRRLLKA
jgi:hypothetical protein